MKTLTNFILLLLMLAGSASSQNYTWTQKANFPGAARYEAAAFSIGSKGYFCTGANFGLNTVYKDLWEYDQLTNIWTQKADLPATARFGASGFSVGTKGFIVAGWTAPPSSQLKDVWQYNPATNTWAQKADFGGAARYDAIALSIGTNAYVGFGYSPYQKDWWKFNPGSNAWTQKANFPGSARQSVAGFVLNNKAYLGTGSDGSNKKDFWMYNPLTNTWIQKADFGGVARFAAVGFSIGNLGFIGLGWNAANSFNDFQQYNPNNNTWSAIANMPGPPRLAGDGFSIGNKGYAGLGRNGNTYYNDFWEYGQSLTVVVTTLNPPCHGSSYGIAAASASGGSGAYSFLWSNGVTTSVNSGIPAGTYTVTVTDTSGLTGTATAVIIGPPPIQIALTPNTSICKGHSVSLNSTVNGGTPPYSYSWTPGNFNGPSPTVSPAVTTTYTITVTDANGCTGTGTVQVKVFYLPSASITASNGGVACFPDSVMLSTTASANLSYQWKKNGVVIPGASNSVYYATTTGSYKVIVTNLNGCSKASSTVNVTVQHLNGYINPSGSVTVCNGSLFTMLAIPSSGYLYQWRRNGININGAIASVYVASQSGNYRVLFTDTVTNCTFLTPATVVTYINCRMSASKDIVYPNPSAGDFTFSFSSFDEGAITLSLIDASGKLVSEFKNLSNSSGLTIGQDLQPGIYFVRVEQNGESVTYRIVKTNQ